MQIRFARCKHTVYNQAHSREAKDGSFYRFVSRVYDAFVEPRLMQNEVVNLLRIAKNTEE